MEVKVPAASHTACGRAGLKPDMDSNQRPPSFLPALKTDRLGGTVGAAPALHLKTPGCLLPTGPGSSVPLRQAHSSHTPSAAPPSCTAASHGRGGKRKAGKERRRERRGARPRNQHLLHRPFPCCPFPGGAYSPQPTSAAPPQSSNSGSSANSFRQYPAPRSFPQIQDQQGGAEGADRGGVAAVPFPPTSLPWEPLLLHPSNT